MKINRKQTLKKFEQFLDLIESADEDTSMDTLLLFKEKNGIIYRLTARWGS